MKLFWINEELDVKIKASKMDVIWSYVGTIFSLSSGFILLPFILLFLNNEQVGMWYILLSFLIVVKSTIDC